MIVLACETCRTITELDADATIPAAHIGHLGTAIEGDDREALWATAARHLELARRLRDPGPFGLASDR